LVIESALLQSEWRQGVVLPHELVPEGALPKSATTDSKLVVISHDCDLVNPSFEAEPYLEVFVARPKTDAARNSLLFNGKSPRKLQFFAQESTGRQLYEINVNEKFRLDRRILQAGSRDKTISINPEDVLVLAKWAMRRYHRPSLPSAFQNRLSPAVKGIRKKLEKDGEDVQTIYLGLNSLEELGSEEQYSAWLRLVVAPEVCENDEREKRVIGVVSEIRKLISQCKGISVEDANLISEAEITLHEVRHLVRWDFDYMSPEDENPGA
jgi:hypothetical protein